MLLDEAGEILEMFKNSFPFSFLFFIPILIIISPVGPVSAAHEFAVSRMQQYDLQGSSYGCRNALVNVEARTMGAQTYTRRCVLAKLSELTADTYRDIVLQNAGGLLVLLPSHLQHLSPEEQQHLLELEEALLQEETQMPVYFSAETPDLLNIYSDVNSATNMDSAPSAAQALISAATANGFQMVVTGPQSKALSDFQVVNIQGKLGGFGIEEQLPTIAIVAHYDAFGIAPSLSTGADSNASGVAALMELARLFSKLYINSRTHAKFNLLFLLSGAGKFNYQGTKRWIEDQLDTTEASLLSDVSFVLCLDSLAAGDGLILHVSKPPKEGSIGDKFMKGLEEVTKVFHPTAEFSMVHKKINLADDYLAWEHERFSIRRLPAYTLSHLDSHRDLLRTSILDTREAASSKVLARNIKVISEALARDIFNLSIHNSFEIFSGGQQVEEVHLSAWLDYLCSYPRAAQLLDKDSSVVSTLEQAMVKYLKDVRKHSFRSDKRDPEFVFYSGADYTMTAYNVKPAVFDLFLALGIAAYLALIYLFVQYFGYVHVILKSLQGSNKMKVQ